MTLLNAHQFAHLRWTGGVVRDVREVGETMTFVPFARLFLGETAFGRFIDPGREAQTNAASQLSLSRAPWRLTHLRYCEVCAREHERLVGRGAWLRCHNLPGVAVCHLHGTRLHQEPIRRGRLSLVPRLGNGERLRETTPEELRYAEIMARLLDWQGPVIHFSQWEAALSSRLAKYGKGVRHVLRDEIEGVYGKVFLSGLGLAQNDLSRSPLDGFVCKPVRSTHPVFIVLAAELLCSGGIQELISDAMTHKAEPFSSEHFAGQQAAAKAKAKARKFKLNEWQLAYILRARRKRVRLDGCESEEAS